MARGEAVGAVWTITGGRHDTTALCVRDSELVRMSKSAFKVGMSKGVRAHPRVRMSKSVRGSELVRMSKSAFKVGYCC